MRRHLNTLYVATQGTYLSKDGENVVVKVNGETRLRVPIHNLDSLVCFGNVLCSPFLLGLCAKRGVTVSFLRQNGRFMARVVGPTQGNVLLRREQYRRADDLAASAEIARTILAGKLSNCRSLLRRAAREHRDAEAKESITTAAQILGRSLSDLEREPDLNTLRGIEGAAARAYFEVFDHLILHQKDSFFFTKRSRRPPLDNVNALLSFLYTLVRIDVTSALESAGLDPAVGFLHRDRPGRPGLALDLMEELRPVLGDRIALSLVNLRKIKGNDFKTTESGGVLMDDDARKTVLTAYQERKQDVITHPFLNEKTTLGLVCHLQALLLARFLRGDLDAYPPFLTK